MAESEAQIPYVTEYISYFGKEGEKVREGSTLLEMPSEELQVRVQAELGKIKDLTVEEKAMFADLTKVEMIALFTIFPIEKIKKAQVVRDPISKDVFLVNPEFIASGGFGNVYKGFDGKFRRAVAMKTLLKNSPENNEKLQREVWAQAKEEHPNIVKIYSFTPGAKSAHPDFNEKPIMVMEYLGPERSKRLDRFVNVTPEEAVSLCNQLCSAIASLNDPKLSRVEKMMTRWGYSPERGARLLHLDIKPKNIMVANGVVKLTDFGIASSVMNLAAPSETVHGSPEWMSPERWRGDELDVSSELFSITSVLYHTLTGESFFETYDSSNTYDSRQTMMRILFEEFVMTDKLIAYCEKHGLNKVAVERFFSFAWAKKKEDRFKNIDEYRNAFALAMRRVNPAQA